MTSMPLFSYPTTIVLIDDDQLFLKALNLQLNKHFLVKSFSDVNESLSFFKKYKPVWSSEPFLRGCSEHEISQDSAYIPVDLNAKALSEIRKNPNRFQDVSVVIVDYKMPNINGLDFCRAIHGMPIKKILLTGAVDYPDAVLAFNEGIIDRYIRKDNLNLIEEINQHISNLTMTNFFERTKNLLDHLELDGSLPFSDSLFANFFRSWCIENEICEYFLLDKQGNLVAKDINGSVVYFIVHTDRTLSNFIELHSEDKEISSLISQVSKRSLIPFFEPDNDLWKNNELEWKKHFHTPKIFEGKEKYYWAAIKGKI